MARVLLLVFSALWSWLAMQAVHELGHALAALATGGTIQAVRFHPLSISQTFVDPNPHPGIVVWMGPVLGAVLPVLLWGLARAARLRFAWFLQFFAGFCLIANGAYIGTGIWDPVGDAADLVRLGVPPWQLALFGLPTFSTGLWCWDGISREFGWGKNARSVSFREPFYVAGLLTITAITGWWHSS
ncbi:MAG: M50 family metallopeptidase [Planctomycetaceae bacterium]|nr:M50 family metallopeptidase [Planctomycetaceae bacterium]